MQCKLARTF